MAFGCTALAKSLILPMKKFNPTIWKKTGLAVAIIIMLNVFFNVGLDTFYDAPQYDDFCEEEMRAKPLRDVESCDSSGGEWVEDGEYSYCDSYDNTCYEELDVAQAAYNEIAFIVLTILGTLSIVFGLYTKMPMAVAHGFVYGGTLSMIIGSMRYWSDMEHYLQFIVSGIALIILILLGVKKLKD